MSAWVRLRYGNRKTWQLIFPITKLIVTHKTAYEILAIRPNATQDEIRENYNRLIVSLKAQKSLFNPADYELKLDAVNQAYELLATVGSKAEYDEQLATQTRLVKRTPSPSVASDPTSLALRAEAISLRAEAISLRADALAIHSQVGAGNGAGHHPAGVQSLPGGLLPMFKKLAMLVGVAVAVWMVIQVAWLLFSTRRMEVDASVAASAREKVIIQEYYQTNGVRPSSAIEAELLEVQNRKKETEVRNLEREKSRQTENERQFERDARRRADQVSAELRSSEKQERERARHEDEQKASRLEQQKQVREERESTRIENEKAKWENEKAKWENVLRR